MARIDPDRIQEVRELFGYFDADRNGYLDPDEFERFLAALAEGEATETPTKVSFDHVDTNKNGRIEFSEFLDWWLGRHK